MEKDIITKQENTLEFWTTLLFISIGISLRLFPHPPNFAPIVAIALFGGVYLSRKIALILPLIIMAVSDLFIGFYEPKLMASVYGSLLLFGVIGFWLKKHKKWYTILGSAFVSSVIFFLLTNFAVWAFTPWYPQTISGLIWCYLMALPFFKNTILGNFFYVSCFFGAYEMAAILVRIKTRQRSFLNVIEKCL
jgi:hypothetical protein